jgi:3-hydroxyacyl-[acyl-carrier-protein] dehydratase
MVEVGRSGVSTSPDLLPHRPPFLFIHRVVDLRRGVEGRAEWRITGQEAFFQGHFPDRPVVPGVLIVEALAQLSGLVGLHLETQPVNVQLGGRLAHVDIRFEREVRPPRVIQLHAGLQRSLGALRQFGVRALVDDQSVASGSLTLAEVHES